jgi:hypothetical protein
MRLQIRSAMSAVYECRRRLVRPLVLTLRRPRDHGASAFRPTAHAHSPERAHFRLRPEDHGIGIPERRESNTPPARIVAVRGRVQTNTTAGLFRLRIGSLLRRLSYGRKLLTA